MKNQYFVPEFTQKMIDETKVMASTEIALARDVEINVAEVTEVQ